MESPRKKPELNVESLAWDAINQAKHQTKMWFMAFLITLAGLISTNIYWISIQNSYEYVYQRGQGQNNYNNNVDGDINNVSADKAEEER